MTTSYIMRLLKNSLFIFLGLFSFSIHLPGQGYTTISDNHRGSTVWTVGQLNRGQVDRVHGSEIKLKETAAFDLVRARKASHFHAIEKSGTANLFIDPVQQKPGLNDPGFYSIIAYFDHDQLYPDHVLDYQCGNITFDNAEGYNHGGTDYFPWPFPWRQMYQEEMEVIAASSGVLIFKQDGNFDQQCELNGEPWNGLTILHADGSTSWYIHLKDGSLTEKETGAQIEAGEYLGIIGSSGNTLAPHLHFEVYNDLEELIDPFAGTCNNTVTASWWENQAAYLESGVNKISTNSALPVFSDCPLEEIPNENEQFHPGDTIWLLSYFRNIYPDDLVQVTITRPDNSVFYSWYWNSPWDFYTASWLYFYIVPDANEQKGTWLYQLDYKGATYQQAFQYLESQSIKDNSESTWVNVHPNPVGDMLTLEFEKLRNGFITIELWSMEGKMVSTYNMPFPPSQIIKLNLSDFHQGVYVVRVKQGKEIQNLRVVKM